MSPVLSKPPPRTPVAHTRGYGKYCIKARGKVITKKGENHIDVTGFDTSMDIVERVGRVLRVKSCHLDMVHTEVEVIILPESYSLCDGTIFANYTDAGVTMTFPPDSFL